MPLGPSPADGNLLRALGAAVAAAAWIRLLQRFCPALHPSGCAWGAAGGAATSMSVSTLIIVIVARRCSIELHFLHLQRICPSLHPLRRLWCRAPAPAAAALVTVEVVIVVRAAGGCAGVAGGSGITAAGLHSTEANQEGVHLLLHKKTGDEEKQKWAALMDTTIDSCL